jgi:hypothetical protein
MTKFLFFYYLLISLDSDAQFFSGKITYADSFKSKTPDISSEDLEKYIGAKRELYIQNSFYKDVHSGELKSVMIYRGESNRLYDYSLVSDTVYWVNALSDTLSKISYSKIDDSNEIILGLKCKKITIESELGSTIYFFNENYPINPNEFSDHNLNFWNFYTLKTKSIPLKVIFENDKVILTSIAVKIEEIELADSVFTIPRGILKKRFP